jgi:hypothetical protein
MVKIIPIVLCLALALLFCVTIGTTFEHKTFTDTEDYSKIFELTELRFDEVAMELFPGNIEGLTASDFYCEWEVGIVGSAKAEILLSAKYNEADFDEEMARLRTLADGKILYDTQTFQYPAYVSVLGYQDTNYYALIDEENQTIHYLLLQLIKADDIDINHAYLPEHYIEFGANQEHDFNVYYNS